MSALCIRNCSWNPGIGFTVEIDDDDDCKDCDNKDGDDSIDNDNNGDGVFYNSADNSNG